MSDETELIQKIQNGIDVDLNFKQLIIAHQERIYWHIRGMVEYHDDANDVMQNTFIKAYKSIHNYKHNAKFFTWLYTIATNESINHINKKKNKKTAPIEDYHNEHRTLSESSYIEGSEIQQVLADAIATLPEKQKQVFQMKYFEELKYQEIAEILGTSVGALKASYHHACKKIESYVKTKSYG